jgi:hypothetical protein
LKFILLTVKISIAPVSMCARIVSIYVRLEKRPLVVPVTGDTRMRDAGCGNLPAVSGGGKLARRNLAGESDAVKMPRDGDNSPS